MNHIIKKSLCIALLAIFSTNTYAQLSKGNLMVGGSANSTIGNGSSSFGLYPSAAYFIKDYVALGGSLDFNYSRYSNNTNSAYFALSAMGRFYLLHSYDPKAKNGFPVFLQARIGLNTSTAVIFASGGLGANYFLTPNVALEASVGANMDNTGFANVYTMIGFQIFLPTSVFKKPELK